MLKPTMHVLRSHEMFLKSLECSVFCHSFHTYVIRSYTSHIPSNVKAKTETKVINLNIIPHWQHTFHLIFLSSFFAHGCVVDMNKIFSFLHHLSVDKQFLRISTHVDMRRSSIITTNSNWKGIAIDPRHKKLSKNCMTHHHIKELLRGDSPQQQIIYGVSPLSNRHAIAG